MELRNGNWTAGARLFPTHGEVPMEATIFAGWIYDLPHAEQVKVAHPLMLRHRSGH